MDVESRDWLTWGNRAYNERGTQINSDFEGLTLIICLLNLAVDGLWMLWNHGLMIDGVSFVRE